MQDQQDSIEKLEGLLWQVSQRINLHTRRFLVKEGLTMARFIALNNLVADKPFSMGDLQRRLCLAPGTLTGLIDGLVEEGLVTRWREDCDRRAVYLVPTPKGEELLKRVFDYRVSLLKSSLAAQQDLDIEIVNLNLNKISVYLNAISVE
jgi:DNA-binding MarR family transcriptional regulator